MEQLNQNELEALRILWEHGDQKPGEIQEHFAREIDNGTLRSVLRVLMDKGFVMRTKQGRAYVYRAKASRERLLARMMNQMAHVFAGGSQENLLLQLVKSEALSPETVAELKRIAAAKGGRGKS